MRLPPGAGGIDDPTEDGEPQQDTGCAKQQCVGLVQERRADDPLVQGGALAQVAGDPGDEIGEEQGGVKGRQKAPSEPGEGAGSRWPQGRAAAVTQAGTYSQREAVSRC